MRTTAGPGARWRSWGMCVAMAAALPGCWTSASDGEAMRRDINELQADLRGEREARAAERARLQAETAEKARALQEAMDALNRAARKSGADLAVDLEKAQNEVAQVRGQLEVLQHRTEQLEAKTAQQDEKIAEGQAAMAKQKALAAAEHPTDKAGIYSLGVRKLEDGDSARARELFKEFLARFPKDALASNAQYWLGETYYEERRYNDAIVELQKVLKQWKGSEKVPDALLKIGLSFQGLGECPKARPFFEEVVASHRGTEAAKVAKVHSAECAKARSRAGASRR